MIALDWAAFGYGLALGVAVSAAYFAGLAFGVTMALRRGRVLGVLMLSAALRIALLLAGGWGALTLWGPWAALGYAAAFLVTRFVVTSVAREGGATT